MSVRTIPILPTPNQDELVAFYEQLGFTQRGRWPDEYLILEHPNGIELHFWFHAQANPLTNDVACFIRFESRAESFAFYDQCYATGLRDTGGVPRLGAPEDTEWDHEWHIVDVHGNLLRFGATPEPQ